jgi:hypothetical protein
VHANLVYAELIRDRNHLHMNATKWTSLTEFIKYLGRTGKATVDETPKGLLFLFPHVCVRVRWCVCVCGCMCVVCAID